MTFKNDRTLSTTCTICSNEVEMVIKEEARLQTLTKMESYSMKKRNKKKTTKSHHTGKFSNKTLQRNGPVFTHCCTMCLIYSPSAPSSFGPKSSHHLQYWITTFLFKQKSKYKNQKHPYHGNNIYTLWNCISIAERAFSLVYCILVQTITTYKNNNKKKKTTSCPHAVGRPVVLIWKEICLVALITSTTSFEWNFFFFLPPPSHLKSLHLLVSSCPL